MPRCQDIQTGSSLVGKGQDHFDTSCTGLLNDGVESIPVLLVVHACSRLASILPTINQKYQQSHLQEQGLPTRGGLQRKAGFDAKREEADDVDARCLGRAEQLANCRRRPIVNPSCGLHDLQKCRWLCWPTPIGKRSRATT